MKLYKQKSSNIDNRGLFASKNIKKGTKIIYYTGKIITKKQTENNPKFDNDKAIYLFNLNNRYDLDGDSLTILQDLLITLAIQTVKLKAKV